MIALPWRPFCRHDPQVERYLDLQACRVDLAARIARWPDGDRTLTPTETKLLTYLVEQEGRAVPRHELLKEVWGYRGGVVTRTVKTTVGRLRTKIEAEPGAPQHLQTAVGVGYRFEAGPAPTSRPAPPPPPSAEARTNLPPGERELIGRQAVLDQLDASSTRLLTVTGPAGVGKTALLHRWAAAQATTSAWQEVAWCDLATARGDEDVRRAVAAALGMARGTDEAGGPWLRRALQGRGRLLLVLDTAEGCVNAAADEVEGWLDGCPDLRVLVGSREALRLGDEQVVPLPPLEPEQAAQLFAQRLPGDALPGYAEPQARRAVVARLDGLPLALEMAAAWAPLLAPDRLADRLVTQLDLLSGDRRDRPQRHASLRAAIGSSWELLDADQREVLRQLSAFAGPFRPADAEAVVRAGRPTLLVLRDLVARSLLGPPPAEAPDGEARLALFAAVRDFAREQGVSPEAEERHGSHFARWGTPERIEALRRRGGAELAALDADRDDLVAAGERAVGRAHWATALATARALGLLASFRGPDRADPELLAEASDDPDPAHRSELALLQAELALTTGASREALRQLAEVRDGAALLARAARHRALLLLQTTPAAASSAAEEAVALAAAAGDPDLQARASAAQAWIQHQLAAADDAGAALEAAAEQLDAQRDASARAEALCWLAAVHLDRGRPIRSASLLQAALDLQRAVGDRRAEAALLLTTASSLADQDDLAGARRGFEEAEELLARLGDRLGVARAHLGLAGLSVREARFEQARPALDSSLAVARDARDRGCEAQALEALGALELALGHHGAAATALLAATGLAHEAGLTREEGAALGSLGRLRAAEGELEDARGCFSRGDALLGAPARRADRVRLLEDWAQVEADAGDEAEASRLLNLAEEVSQLSVVDGPVML